jgi:serine phosphatase RsbU (regulator of sigma subunit)
MKIRTKIILSYILIIIIISMLWCFTTLPQYKILISKNLEISTQTLKNYFKKTEKLSEGKLELLSKKYLQLINQKMIGTLSPLIQYDLKNKIDIATDPKIKNVVNYFLKINNKIIIGYSFLMTSNNKLIVSPNTIDLIVKPKEFKSHFHELYKLMNKAKKVGSSEGYYNFYYVNNQGIPTKAHTKKFGYFSKIPNTDYYLGTTIFLSNYQQYTNRILLKEKKSILISLTSELSKTFTHELYYTFMINLIIISFVILLFIFLGWLLASSITKPIHNLTKIVKTIGLDNIDFSIKIDSKDKTEVGKLSRAFNFLSKELNVYMDHFKKDLKRKQSIESELEIAKDIQISSLPNVTEDFIRPEFELYAKVKPARIVSGDFYDFFYISENKIAILVADVSGKGISAAFFMANFKIMLKTVCLDKKNNPAKALEKANNIICDDNKAFMFVTVFLAYYDIKTGELKYANAGHHSSVVINKTKESNEFGVFNNTVIGLYKNIKYEIGHKMLKKGDELVLYTDGILEAVSPENELYGSERFIKTLKKNQTLPLRGVFKKVYEDINKFEETNKQFDDITMLILRRYTDC